MDIPDGSPDDLYGASGFGDRKYHSSYPYVRTYDKKRLYWCVSDRSTWRSVRFPLCDTGYGGAVGAGC